MKTLYLLRHAKSSWKDPRRDDFDRPLSKRGRAAAQDIGKFLAEHAIAPAHILCSPARRTRETLERAQKKWHRTTSIDYERSLYLADQASLAEHLRRLSDVLPSVMLIGHNPGLQNLALMIVGDDDPLRPQVNEKFPTGALLVLSLSIERWRDVAPASGRIERLVLPRDLGR